MGQQLKGYSSKQISTQATPQDIHITAEPIREQQLGMTVNSHAHVTLIGSDASEAGGTTRTIVATAHAARAGDVISFTSGTHAGREVKAYKVDTNTIYLGEILPAAPGVGDTFDILRHVYPRVSATGSTLATISGIGFKKDGSDVLVTEDTITPANNIPLPVKLTSVTGDINITAGDLNVQLTHAGVNFDSTRIGDGTDLLAVNADGSINAVVSATDLDVRDLTHASDSVKVGDGTDLLAVNADGSINAVNVTPSLDVQYAHYHNYASVNVTTAAYTQIHAAIPFNVKKLQIFDGSGRVMLISLGGAGSEVAKLYVVPGGNGDIDCVIAAGTRVAIKAIDANATTGALIINFIG